MTFYKIIYYLISIQCILSEYPTFEDLAISDNQLFFSFDKETHNNFEFNIENEAFKIDSLLNRQFENNHPLRNFINSFCLFFQYSLIKFNNELQKAISAFFKSFYDENSSNGESIVTVENYLEMLSGRIKEVLNEKNVHRQLVFIEEIDRKIICKLNYSFEISDGGKIRSDFFFTKNKSLKIIFDFFMKFNELDVQGFFGTDVLNSLESLNDEYFERLLDSTSKVSERFDYKLFEIYSKMHQNPHEVDGCILNISKKEDIDFFKLFLGNCVLKCARQKYKK